MLCALITRTEIKDSKASILPDGKPTRWTVFALVALAALLIAPGAAARQPPLHPPLPKLDDVSSVNQYVELIPTVRGSKAPAPSEGRLPVALAGPRYASTDPGTVARAAAVGRPARMKPATGSSLLKGSLSGALSSAAGALVPRSGGSDVLPVLLAVLAAITAAAAGAAGRRRPVR
jgi:hypothetical protein